MSAWHQIIIVVLAATGGVLQWNLGVWTKGSLAALPFYFVASALMDTWSS